MSPVNCGKGMAVLGPSGMTIECANMDANGVSEVVDESKACFKCMTDEERETDKTTVWDNFVAWRRTGREHDYDHD
jgi:hypothetical protein